MELKDRGKGLQRKQALAAIGQGRLIAMWDNLFGMVGTPIAQILLTRQDISDVRSDSLPFSLHGCWLTSSQRRLDPQRQRYLNAQNTFTELLSMGVIPIVNENDTVSVQEIKFGDNDTLSAITANMVHADYLFLLTDVDCL
jgi:glutamate 5-kinase